MSKPKILTDIKNKIDKDSIVNDFSTGGADKVASAETLKMLNSSIINKGYLSPKQVSDFNNVLENGKYTGYNALNAPVPESTINVEVIVEQSSVITQIGVVAFGLGVGDTYVRVKQNIGVWTEWRKFTTKSDLEQKADIKKSIYKHNVRNLTGLTLLDMIANIFTAGYEYGSLFCYGATDNPPTELDVAWKVITWKGVTNDSNPILVTLESLNTMRIYHRLIFKNAGNFIWIGTWQEKATTDKIDISSGFVNGYTGSFTITISGKLAYIYGSVTTPSSIGNWQSILHLSDICKTPEKHRFLSAFIDNGTSALYSNTPSLKFECYNSEIKTTMGVNSNTKYLVFGCFELL